MTQEHNQLFPTSVLSSSQKAILVIGGAEDKVHGKEILNNFWLRSGGSEATIAIIPSASREPTITGNRYLDLFEAMGVKYVKILDIRDRDQGSDSIYLDYINECTGVFLTGGDQLRLCGLLAETPIMSRIVQRTRSHEITLAGTSAGAAVMGHHMIAGGGSGESPNRSLVDLAMGLDILPEIIVDQHFHNRNRLARLLSAISSHPECLGIGIDEDTCAVFESDQTIRVIGKGTVTIVNAQAISHTNQSLVRGSDPLSIHNLVVHVLCWGDRYDLQHHQPLPQPLPV